MPKRKMRKYLRRPSGEAKDTASDRSRWRRLYKAALSRAEEQDDPRLRDLKHWASDPEKALRRLSILSEVDLNREFPV